MLYAQISWKKLAESLRAYSTDLRIVTDCVRV